MNELPKITLPKCATDYIDLVVKKMGYRRKVRAEVREELTSHFTDALHGISDEQQRVERAMSLIKEFGDARTMATLIRRGKKRCRPLWLKTFIGVTRAAGIAILALIVYTGWVFTGRPYISVNYVAELNKLVRPTADETLNAQPFYDKAISLMSREPNHLASPWEEQVSSEQLAAARQWVAGNSSAIEQVRQGNKKPYYWTAYNSKDGAMMSVVLPQLSAQYSLAKLLLWHGRLNAMDGDFGKAFDCIKEAYLFGQRMENCPTLVEQLVGVGIRSYAVRVAQRTIAMPGVKADFLTAFGGDFERLVASTSFRMSYTFESMCMKDVVQRSFTKSGRIAPREPLAMGTFMADVTGRLRTPGQDLSPIGAAAVTTYMVLTHPNKKATLEVASAFYEKAEHLSTVTPWQARDIKPTLSEYARQLADNNLVFLVMLPTFEKVVNLSWQNNAECHALIAQVAAERYERDRGAYPESLEELQQTGYLKDLPMDPWSDKPLVYRKTADGYTLYSVGEDFIDDGGKPRPMDNQERQKGGWDFVFWPMPRDGGGKK